jgi:uncharacterized protein YchJ
MKNKIKGKPAYEAVRTDGYTDNNGVFHRYSPKLNVNSPCPCGSGKKYKKCCGKR